MINLIFLLLLPLAAVKACVLLLPASSVEIPSLAIRAFPLVNSDLTVPVA